MANPYFKFKQFAVYHDRSSLKVGTDAVLLGAWADVADAERILDIGTGSGVIALMLAQRSAAQIDAIDIDEESTKQAQENFSDSPWSERLRVHNISLNDFAAATTVRYDLIVSNPPYFTDSFKPSDPQRFSARHNDQLPIQELAENTAKLLSANGKFCVILPVKEAGLLTAALRNFGLFPEKELWVYSFTGKEVFRKLILFGRSQTVCIKEELTIETAPGQGYSKEYVELTRAYYLNF
ncbi:MAG: tRNA1(Val) (adenine(37)-N6)-methyltransferase [Bacteroidia bacterium]